MFEKADGFWSSVPDNTLKFFMHERRHTQLASALSVPTTKRAIYSSAASTEELRAARRKCRMGLELQQADVQ
jgi:hypothetical protein